MLNGEVCELNTTWLMREESDSLVDVYSGLITMNYRLTHEGVSNTGELQRLCEKCAQDMDTFIKGLVADALGVR